MTASVGTGPGTLAGTQTATTNTQGVATFTNLKIIGTPGAATLKFTTTLSGQSVNVSSAALNVVLPANGKIVFKSGNDELWVVNADGTGRTKLTLGYGTSTSAGRETKSHSGPRTAPRSCSPARKIMPRNLDDERRWLEPDAADA